MCYINIMLCIRSLLGFRVAFYGDIDLHDDSTYRSELISTGHHFHVNVVFCGFQP